MSRQLVHLIDDDWEVREALSFLLRTVGLEVQPHADGAAFLQALSGLRPGCIVTDIRMPRLTGLKLQERLAAAPRRSEETAVRLTNAQERLAESARALKVAQDGAAARRAGGIEILGHLELPLSSNHGRMLSRALRATASAGCARQAALNISTTTSPA